MGVYLCESCEARNIRGGICTMCGKPLGSLRDAIAAASIAMLLASLFWIGFSWLTGVQISFFAMVFGLAVSGAVAHRTGGRGPLYQAIASGFTLVGMAVSDAVVVRMHWFTINPDWPRDLPLPSLWDQLAWQAQWDGVFVVFVTLGLVGGFWLWR